MPDYKETTVAGTAYTRAHQVVIANPSVGTKAVSFYEEQVINLENEQIIRQQGGVQEPFTADNANEEFALVNPVDGTPIGMTMEYKDVHVALHSLYYHVAAKRDASVAAAAAAAAEAAALAAAVVPTPEVTPEA